MTPTVDPRSGTDPPGRATASAEPRAKPLDLRTAWRLLAGDPKVPSNGHDTATLEGLIRKVVREEMQSNTDHRSANTPIGMRQSMAGMSPELPGELPKEVMSADELAAFLQVDRNTVYDYAGRGLIPCRRLGKRILFHRQAIVAWLNPCKVVDRKG